MITDIHDLVEAPIQKYSDLEQFKPIYGLKEESKNNDVSENYLGFLEKEDSITPIICLESEYEKIVLDWYKTIDVDVCIQSTDKQIKLLENSKYLMKNRASQNIDIKLPPKFKISSSDNKITSTIWTKNWGFYNVLYNVLNPNFGDNCSTLTDVKQLKTLQLNIEKTEIIDDNIELTIIIYMETLQTIVVPNLSSEMKYLLNNRTEYGFIEVFTISVKKKFIEDVNAKFHKTMFFTFENLEEELSLLSELIYPETFNEKDIVMNTFTKVFTKTDLITDRLKASAIYDIIIETNPILANVNQGFKNRLSIYLNDWKLKKKRYNDGIYYYGLVKKQTNIFFKSELIDDNISTTCLFGISSRIVGGNVSHNWFHELCDKDTNTLEPTDWKSVTISETK